MKRLFSVPRLFGALLLLDAVVALLGIRSSYSYRFDNGVKGVNGFQLALVLLGALPAIPLGLIFLVVRHRPARIVLLGLLVATNLFLLAAL